MASTTNRRNANRAAQNTEVANTDTDTITEETPVMDTPDVIVSDDNVVVSDDNVSTDVVSTDDDETDDAPRIPQIIADNSILNSFCEQYLNTFDEITAYNKAVLAEKDSEWNAAKVLEKSREMAYPTDANAPVNAIVKSSRDKFEALVAELSQARKNLLDVTSKELGISLSSTEARDPAVEEPLKAKRKLAIEIGSQLSMIAKMTNDENAMAAITDFLSKNGIPAIGRDQVRTFGAAGTATPKFRVLVEVKKGDETVISESGFTKAALALTSLYERGKAPKSDALRDVWTKAGNTSEKTVQSPVEFDDNGLHFVITKK